MDSPHVYPEIAPLDALVRAVRALERLLSRVSQLVIFQLKHKMGMSQSNKYEQYLGIFHSFAAIFTHHRFELLARVRGLVLLHILGRVQYLATIGAGVLLSHLEDQTKLTTLNTL